jgi:hypothetical protein
MATKMNIKCMALSVSEKLEIIKKADAQPHVMCTTVAKQLSITVLERNILENKKNILQQCVATQPGRKKLKTYKYERIESAPRVV